ncbi:transcription termination/antitermination factor NusG [Boudabousia liubingyangii]|uniref:Transcription termination/antitermination protein NusG n=1 Tax=Boudabousia liubingyangii TaxID=1921764 RepID=A0A1Q5PQ66_9ACTO|nr:transcription termination/antitermination protein NusG [Boudabousia liubingyangii]OKL48577.1 transcription termination/antitermination factor NusG [Boudabousia liubingyangii]OKL49694.1 transcription termination/antitermination factor NusG [Boudabousia liubingyangii]
MSENPTSPENEELVVDQAETEAEETETVESETAAEEAPEAAVTENGEAEAANELLDSTEGPVDVEKAIRDRLNKFRNDLRLLPGNWYIVHSYSGHERKVKANLEQRRASLDMEDYIHEVVVPMEEVIEMKNATRKKITRVRMPGYVMVRMSLDPDNAVLRTVKDTPAVTGFVGDSRLKDREDQIPTPLSFQEAYAMLAPSVEQEFTRELEAAAVATPEKAVRVEFEIGENVTVINGPFAGQTATVAEVMPESKKLVVTLTLFGRDTSTELAMEDVSKQD